MVQSILDTDLYKFSTSNAYFQLYPLAEGTFTFNDRSKEVYDEAFLAALKAELARMCNLALTDDEFDYVCTHVRYISRNYWEWLRGFRFEEDKIDCRLDEEGHLKIDVTDLLYKVTLYEVPILATVAELRNLARLDAKIELANREELVFSEFGTRRRFSSELHEAVVRRLKEACPKYCAGTSNVLYAKMFNLIPVGTFPHEWMMFHSGVFGYKRANYLGLEDWIAVYDGALGTALIDTFTTASFLRTLTLKQAKLLDGFRQDSGDEIEIGEMIIARLEEFGRDSYKIDAVPQLVGDAPAGPILSTIARDLSESGTKRGGDRWREEIVAKSVARSFADASQALTAEGATKLVEELGACRMPYVCPRGKPVMIFTSTRELDRKFNRL